MSGDRFVGVALSRDLTPTAVVLTLSPDRRSALIEKRTLERLPRHAVVAVDRFDTSTLIVALYEAGHRVLPTLPSPETRRAVAHSLRLDQIYRTSQDLVEAHRQAMVFANDETRRFRDLSELGKAAFYAMAAATLFAAPGASARGLQQRDARRQALDDDLRFFGIKVPLAGGLKFLFGVAYGGVETNGRQIGDDGGQIAQQRQGGDFLGRAGAGEKITEHQGDSKVAGCGTATGARVAGRFEQAAGDDQAEATL